MLSAGLVSVTFRKLSPREIVTLMTRAGIEAVEWGGDVHVPHGDAPRAKEVAEMTAGAGLRVSAYGSYYRVGDSEDVAFADVLNSATALRAPLVRVWAGRKGSDEADPGYRARVVEDARRIAGMAGAAGIGVAFEFHAKTLTDTNDSARRLLEEIAHPNVGSYWQPPVGKPDAYCLEGLTLLGSRLRNLHAFSWSERGERLPLQADESRWGRFLETAASLGGDHDVLIEFVKDDSEEAFLDDAATLRRWLGMP